METIFIHLEVNWGLRGNQQCNAYGSHVLLTPFTQNIGYINHPWGQGRSSDQQGIQPFLLSLSTIVLEKIPNYWKSFSWHIFLTKSKFKKMEMLEEMKKTLSSVWTSNGNDNGIKYSMVSWRICEYDVFYWGPNRTELSWKFIPLCVLPLEWMPGPSWPHGLIKWLVKYSSGSWNQWPQETPLSQKYPLLQVKHVRFKDLMSVIQPGWAK